MTRINALCIVILSCILSSASLAQKKVVEPSASAMLENVARGFEGIQDFVATIEAEVDMERVRVPKMTATMYFKKPDKVHFSSTNFAMLPREGILLNPSNLRQRYEPTALGEDTLDGRKVYRIRLTARERTTRLSRLMLWIDPTNWTIARMESVPYQGRVLRLVFTYALQGGSHWLPQTLKASFELTARDSLARQSDRQVDPDMQAPPQLQDFQRPSRAGSITVRYLEYKVNTGLSDDIFEKREGGSKLQ